MLRRNDMKLLVVVGSVCLMAACSSSKPSTLPSTTTSTTATVAPISFPVLPPYHGRTPAVRVVVSKGCPAKIPGVVDVRNPRSVNGRTLLPAHVPTAGLMCAYGPDGASLGSRLLSQTEASAFATVINRVRFAADGGPLSCPMDSGRIYVLAFAYRDAPDADLWWHASGCQSLDNGTKLTIEGGNPSFYLGFDEAAQRLHA